MENPASIDPQTMPLEKLEEIINAGTAESQPAAQEQTIEPTKEPAPVQGETGQVTEPAAPEAPKPEEPAKVPEVGKPTEFAKLQQETGVPNPDVLAKNYRELQKMATQKSQELAELKKNLTQVPEMQTPAPQSQPAPQVQPNMQNLNAELLEGLNNRTYETLKDVVLDIVQPLIKPLAGKQVEVDSRTEYMRLANSRETAAEFNRPEVQEEIGKIVLERPQTFTYRDETGVHIYPNAYEDLFLMAKGRLGAKLYAAQQQTIPSQPQGNPPPVEGRNKMTPVTQAFDPKTAPLDQLEAHINAQTGKVWQ